MSFPEKEKRRKNELEVDRKTLEEKAVNNAGGRFLGNKVTRRQAIGTMGKVAIGVVATAVVAAGAFAAYDTYYKPAPVTTTSVSTVSVGPTTESLAAKAKRLATAKPGEKFLIGFDTFFLSLEASTIMAKSITQACNALGLNVDVKDSGFSVTAPIDNARTLIAEGAKGIIGFAGNPASYYEVAKICEDNNVFFYSLWDMEPFAQPWSIGDHFLAWAYQDGETDLYTASTLVFQKLKQDGKASGPVLNLQGDTSFSNCIKNMGIVDAWLKYPDIQLVGHQYTNWDASTAKSAAATQLSSTPDLAGVLAVNDTLTAAAIAAAKDAGVDLGKYAGGPDGSQSGLTLAVQDDFLAIGAMPDTYIGGLAVCQLYDAITGAYYPSNPERMVCTKDFLIAEDVNEAKSLAAAANFTIPYPVVDAKDYYNTIYTAATYPYDWTVVSRGKAQELGKQYDPSGGVTVSSNKIGGFHSWYDAMGNDYNWSVYMTDAINRFANLNANVYADLNKVPFAPTSASPGIHTYNWYVGKPPTTPL